MILSVTSSELKEYTSRQLNNIFPDNHCVKASDLDNFADTALDRLNFCFSHISFNRYYENGQSKFNHLYTDQYLVYLWFLANTIWKQNGDDRIISKIYYLNKVLHSFDCMYNTSLPDIFLVLHGAGTMLGKATYSDYFLVLQGCTVGSQRGDYPVLGKGVALTANSSIIGKCNIGNRCTISSRTLLFQKDLADDSTAFVNLNNGALEVKQSFHCYAQQYFNVDLKSI
jgi:serine O-acetyltransferase